MRKVLGLIFIILAAALALNGAKSLVSIQGHSGAYLAGQMVGALFIPLILGIIGFRWIRTPAIQRLER